jgi:hypothetical protein
LQETITAHLNATAAADDDDDDDDLQSLLMPNSLPLSPSLSGSCSRFFLSANLRLRNLQKKIINPSLMAEKQS